MKIIGVTANTDKSDARRVLARIAEWSRREGITLVAADSSATLHDTVKQVEKEELRRTIEVMITLGGDGTMLAAVRLLAGADIPLLGVNLGGLGFMTSIPESELE